MPPYLRSFVAQARSVGSRRSFSSTPPFGRFELTGPKATVARVAVTVIGTYGGYSIAEFVFAGIIGPFCRGKYKEAAEKVS